MPGRRFAALSLFALFLALSTGCSKSSQPSAPDGDAGGGAAKATRLKIAVVPKGTTHEFWKSVHAGAVKASRELDCDIVWKGPLKEDDLKGQIDVVQTFIAQGVSGIVLAPLNQTALKAPVHQATESKIPVVVIDSDLEGSDPVSFVATDNVAAGKIAADGLAKAMGNKGSVVVLRYQEGSASTQNREKGFLEATRARSDMKVISDTQYGGATTESAFQKSESLLLSLKADSGAVHGVFAPNESTTFGMLLALRKTNVVKKTKFVGFDASDKLLGALRDGELDALVVQNPFNMGYLAVKTMVDALRGKKVESRIDTGAQLVTRETLDDPQVRAIVQPDLKTWLNE